MRRGETWLKEGARLRARLAAAVERIRGLRTGGRAPLREESSGVLNAQVGPATGAGLGMSYEVADVLLAATVTEAGMVSAALLPDSATLVPPVGAAWFRVTVQVVEAPEFTLVGLQASAVTSMGATRLKVAV